MQNNYEAGTEASPHRNTWDGADAHTTPLAICPRGCAVLWTAAFWEHGEAAEATMRTPLLRRQGTQRPTKAVLWQGGGATPETTITVTSCFFPPRAGFSTEP